MEFLTEHPNGEYRLPMLYAEDAEKAAECGILKIILLEEGSMIAEVGGKSSVASAPMLFCLNGRERFSISKAEGIVMRVLYFHPSIINMELDMENIFEGSDQLPPNAILDHFYFLPFTERTTHSAGRIDVGLTAAKRLSELLEKLKLQMSGYEDRFWPCRCRSFLIEILFLIQHCWSKREDEPVLLKEAAFDLNEILLYLHLNYSRKIMIEELTSKFHTNRNTLNKRFRKEIGVSVFEYVLRLRIRVACMLLKDTSLPVNEIAGRAGFEDISYWGRAFRKYTGMTPSDYRKQAA